MSEGYRTLEYNNYLIKTREHKGKYTGGIYDKQDTTQYPFMLIIGKIRNEYYKLK